MGLRLEAAQTREAAERRLLYGWRLLCVGSYCVGFYCCSTAGGCSAMGAHVREGSVDGCWWMMGFALKGRRLLVES